MKLKKGQNTKIKLHFGCGNNYLDDWINIDNNVNKYIKKLDLDWNFKKFLPIKKGCADVIYDANFIERLQSGSAFTESLLSCYRHLLKDEGILQVGLPAMEYKKMLKPWLKKLGFSNIEFYTFDWMAKDEDIITDDIVVIDDDFPQSSPRAFRNMEINELFKKLDNFNSYAFYRMPERPQAHFNWQFGVSEDVFNKNKEGYLKYYPQNEKRIKYLYPYKKYKFKLAYSYFASVTHTLLPFFERNKIPFVFTLYPGGTFSLNHEGSDSALKEIFSSKYFRKVIVTQKVTLDYLLNNNLCPPSKIEYLFGGYVQFKKGESLSKKFYPRDKSTVDICFVAAKYGTSLYEKGYDLFIETAKRIAKKHPQVRFHVVGGFGERDIDIKDIKHAITFYGYKLPDFLKEFYSSMDICISPNRPSINFKGTFDGFPLGGEALSCQTALFTTDELNNNDGYFNENELVIIKPEINDIVEKVEFYLNNLDALYEMSKNGQEKMYKLLDPEERAEKVKNILLDASKNKITKVENNTTQKVIDDTKIKLHFGSGSNYLDGWINIDNNADNNIERLDLNWDSKKHLPLKKDCADVIYDEKFLDRLKLGPSHIESILSFYRHLLKEKGLLQIGLADMKYKEKLEPWLNKLGFLYLEFPKGDNKIKLNIGCGHNYYNGWVNIDGDFEHNIKKLDLNWDLRNPLPFEENSVDFIFNEHLLEHLTAEEGVKSLKDWLRVLRPDGVLRISMPDLAEIVRTYNNENWKIDNAESFNKWGLNYLQTRAEYLNINLRHWGHKWLYDKEELERRLKEAGFADIEFCELRKSKYNELNNLEIRDESTLIAEARKKARVIVKNPNAKPILTALVVTYNHKDYIGRALDSILMQKTNFNFKIIIADDCSTDGTKELCQKYADKYPKIIEFTPKTENIGMCNNVYDSYKKIDTPYFATLDGDDYWIDENKLQMQVDLLEKNPDCVICAHNTAVHDINKDFDMVSANKFVIPNPNNNHVKISLENYRYLHSSSRVYRKTSVDISNNPGLIADACFYQIMLDLGKCIYIDKIMSIYCVGKPNSAYASLPEHEQNIEANNVAFNMLNFFNFRHEEYYIKNMCNPGLYKYLTAKAGKKRGLKLHHYLVTKAIRKEAKRKLENDNKDKLNDLQTTDKISTTSLSNKMNKIPCFVMIFFDFDTIKKSMDFIVKSCDMLDIHVVENYSEFTESHIKPYISNLLKQGKISNYYLFDENIGANAMETVLKTNASYIEKHKYFMLTDGDLVPDNDNWVNEEISIMDNNSDVFVVGMELDMSNLPLKTNPEAIHWVPKAREVKGKDYLEGLTGGWFTLYRTEDFLPLWEIIKTQANVKLVDSTMHQFNANFLHKKWARTKISKAKHLTWDTYADLEHPYTKWKSSFSLDELWRHDRYCGFTLFNESGSKYCNSKEVNLEELTNLATQNK